jgi:hypothetical protein
MGAKFSQRTMIRFGLRFCGPLAICDTKRASRIMAEKRQHEYRQKLDFRGSPRHREHYNIYIGFTKRFISTIKGVDLISDWIRGT